MNEASSRTDRLINIVRQWADDYEQICIATQNRECTIEDFAPIANVIATNEFTRTGVYKEKADWSTCIEQYLQFAGTSLWTGKLRYIHAVDNIVFQELEETITRHHGENVIYTMSVFEFNDDDKVKALRVYMQQAPDEENVLILGTEKSKFK